MSVAYIKDIYEIYPEYFIVNISAVELIDAGMLSIVSRGKSNPNLLVSLSKAFFSMDKKIWYPMTLAENSEVSNIQFHKNWTIFKLLWDAQSDIEMIPELGDKDKNIYNKNIFIKIGCNSGLKESYVSSYTFNLILGTKINNSQSIYEIGAPAKVNGNELIPGFLNYV